MRRSLIHGLLALAVVFGSIGAFVVNSSTAQAASTATPAPPCPANWTCSTMPGGAGTVQIGPAKDVTPVGGIQPFAYIKGYGFQPGNDVYERFCSLNHALTPSMLCVSNPGTEFTGSPTADLKVLPDGTFTYDTQVPLNPPSNGSPFDGIVFGTSPTVSGSFYCDTTSANPCGVVITEPGISRPATSVSLASNSTAVPITYNTEPPNCPGKQTLVTTESDQMMAPLVTAVNQHNCAGSQPFNLFNTELTGDAAVANVYENVRNPSSSATRIAFTTDPEVAAQQAHLPAGHFAIIPVGLTSVVSAFSSLLWWGPNSYPQASQNLTANMDAGIFTGLYTNSGPATDPVDCTGKCTLPPCFQPSKCSLMQIDTDHPGFFLAKNFAAQPLAVQTGATQAITSYICNAPAAQVPWDGNSSVEAMTGAQVMLYGLKTAGHPFSSCPVTEMWPAEQNPGGGWVAASNAFDQLKALDGAVPQPGAGGGSTVADFAYMYAPWADYLGLQSAGQLNAANAFVTPSAQSLDAAVADSTLNPDGTLTTSYTNTTDASAYPLPAVIYAVVSTDTMPAAEKTSIQGALNQLLDVTGGSSTASLPSGYVLLPSSLYKQATAEVSDAVGNPNFKITDVLPQLAGATTPGSTTGSSFTTSGFAAGSFGAGGLFVTTHGIFGHGAAGKGSLTQQPVPSSSPLYGSILLTASSSRMLIPWMILLGGIVFIVGALLVGWGSISRLVRRPPAAPEGAEATAVEDSP